MSKVISTLSLLFLVILLVIAMAALTNYYNRAPSAGGQDGSFAYRQEYGAFLPVIGGMGMESLSQGDFIRKAGS